MNEDPYELAAHLCSKPDDADCEEVDNAFFEKYEIEMDRFAHLMTDLLPMIGVGTSSLSGKTYKGFAVNNRFLMKVEISP